MPKASSYIENPMLLRELFYGPPKARKTWLALRAVEAGLNVVLIDGDDGAHIVSQIDPQYMDRITIVNAVDKAHDPVFAKFIGYFMKLNNPFYWDETTRSHVLVPDPTHHNVLIDKDKLDENTVLIIDSWTALAVSTTLNFALENKIDLSDAGKVEWDGYGYQGRFLDFVLNKMHTLKCHVIVIGHETVYEKRTKDGKSIESSRTQIFSSSGPHARKMGKDFSDIFRFKFLGPNVQISTHVENGVEGGSRLLPPSSFDWEKFSYAELLNRAGQKNISYVPQTAFVCYEPGDELPSTKKASSFDLQAKKPEAAAPASVSKSTNPLLKK